jgi:hypothetical protein
MNLSKNSLSNLQKDIEIYFSNETSHYLDSLMQEFFKGKTITHDRGWTSILNTFINKIETLNISSRDLEPNLEFLSQWKKDFTKKILLPKYLMKNILIDLEEVINEIKQVIVKAAQAKKMEMFEKMCKKTLFNQLQTTKPSERLLKAKFIIFNEAIELKKNEEPFVTDDFTKNFPFDWLKEFLEKIPFKIFKEPALQDLESKIKAFIQMRIENSPKLLTEKLKIVNHLLVELKAENPAFLNNIDLNTSHKERCNLIIVNIKAEILALAAIDEIENAKKNTTFEEFPKSREKIIQKYTLCYLHSNDSNYKILKDAFFNQIKKIENNRYPKNYLYNQNPIIESQKAQKPKKSSFWKRI